MMTEPSPEPEPEPEEIKRSRLKSQTYMTNLAHNVTGMSDNSPSLTPHMLLYLGICNHINLILNFTVLKTPFINITHLLVQM